MRSGSRLKGVAVLQVCCFLLCMIATFRPDAMAQRKPKKAPATPGPMLSLGNLHFTTPEFTLGLVRSSQTVAYLKADDLDFTPEDLLVERSKDGDFHVRVGLAAGSDFVPDARLRIEQPGEKRMESTTQRIRFSRNGTP
jgi:hypothetical protein